LSFLLGDLSDLVEQDPAPTASTVVDAEDTSFLMDMAAPNWARWQLYVQSIDANSVPVECDEDRKAIERMRDDLDGVNNPDPAVGGAVQNYVAKL
jgi:hypothetical protein